MGGWLGLFLDPSGFNWGLLLLQCSICVFDATGSISTCNKMRLIYAVVVKRLVNMYCHSLKNDLHFVFFRQI